MDSPLLQLDSVTIRFGGLTAVSELALRIGPGELIGLIGPNGAGKTTVFNLITGVYQPTLGTIQMAGTPVAGLKPFEITTLGIARTFQNIRLFPEMTALENVMVGRHVRTRSSILGSVLRTRAFKAQEQAIREKFDMSATRYYQVLNALIDNPAALEADPMLVKRLRRLRDARIASR